MASFFESKTGKNVMAKAYGLGAAVVILGALFKIQHYPGADIMLIVGMGVEELYSLSPHLNQYTKNGIGVLYILN